MGWPRLQNPLDWLTQWAHILLGKRAAVEQDGWLLGPIGTIGETASGFIERIAADHQLNVVEGAPGAGLVDSFQELGVNIHPRIEEFYNRTSDFELDAWTEWKSYSKPFGMLVGLLFSKRVQQLYLPMNPLETAQGIKSDIILLVDQDGRPGFRVWHRRLKKSNDNIFYGIYTHCQLPSGKPAMKTIFPLPQGSVTAIFSIDSDEHGNLELISAGKHYGDPGFYVMIEDRNQKLYKHYIPSFRQRIFVYIDPEGTIRADHTMDVWRLQVHQFHYKIVKKSDRGELS